MSNTTVESNPFAVSRQPQGGQGQGGMIAVASSRQAQEVQGMMVLAKKFPRNPELSYTRIMQACQRKGLAEVAVYSYPRGGESVSGPSIRLAEAIAQNWGNIDFGVVELDQRDGESTVMAYCVDLETNTRQSKIFQVPHIRYSRSSGNTPLKDPRDIYEMVANQGARRLRSCILGVIPGDIIDAALEQCEKTMVGGAKEPLIDRLRIMATKFGEDFQVSVEMIEKRLGHKLSATTEHELVKLRKIYVSLRDGMSKREDWFSAAERPEQPSNTNATTTPQPESADGGTPENAGAPAEGSPAPQPSEPAKEVPVEVLGQEKPKRQRKAAAEATPAQSPPPNVDLNSRVGLAHQIRTRLAGENITEDTFVASILAQGFAPPGTTLNQLPSETMKEILESWDAIVAEIGR